MTRTSEVRPELYLGTFECLQCHATVPTVAQQYKFTQPLICPDPKCGNRCARPATNAAAASTHACCITPLLLQ